ncbi:Ankyrin repeat domain-containing protein 17 [Schistosoma japonicum]|uniref:Ankyrin repeat domain-containing protein 17 n=1 Tax=Schistosoma japonicum TaxID=6182 RepID=A0A4Z2CL74_SCHJA|nr:Ankyrin repeat domain-containing protein 17 [Schistosoma japonicum]
MTPCNIKLPDSLPFSGECGKSFRSAASDQPQLADSDSHNLSATANVAPIRSCHSLCSALSTSDCSISSSYAANCLYPAENSTSTSFESSLPALNSFEYGLDTTSGILGSNIDSCLNNLVDVIALPTSEASTCEADLDHDMLTRYCHFHHPDHISHVRLI